MCFYLIKIKKHVLKKKIKKLSKFYINFLKKRNFFVCLKTTLLKQGLINKIKFINFFVWFHIKFKYYFYN